MDSTLSKTFEPPFARSGRVPCVREVARRYWRRALEVGVRDRSLRSPQEEHGSFNLSMLIFKYFRNKYLIEIFQRQDNNEEALGSCGNWVKYLQKTHSVDARDGPGRMCYSLDGLVGEEVLGALGALDVEADVVAGVLESEGPKGLSEGEA